MESRRERLGWGGIGTPDWHLLPIWLCTSSQPPEPSHKEDWQPLELLLPSFSIYPSTPSLFIGSRPFFTPNFFIYSETVNLLSLVSYNIYIWGRKLDEAGWWDFSFLLPPSLSSPLPFLSIFFNASYYLAVPIGTAVGYSHAMSQLLNPPSTEYIFRLVYVDQ